MKHSFCGTRRTFNHFIPVFLTWILPSLNLDTSIVANRVFSQNNNNIIANGVDPDEKSRYEPSHLDLYCLQRCL